MDILAQSIEAITYQDMVHFCDQKVVEGTELDYKKEIPRDLAKHVAAMSNQYGGLIIIGVAEDPQTGTPGTYEGVVNSGKLVERINQVANNVRPLPSYTARTTDEVNGKVFLLLRVNEGGAPPYTTVNDPTVYLRTGNVTTPLRPADADIVRDLHAKRANAEPVRAANVARANALLLAIIEQQDAARAQLRKLQEVSGNVTVSDQPLTENLWLLTAYLQPFYPQHELALPRVIDAKLHDLLIRSSFRTTFSRYSDETNYPRHAQFRWSMRDFILLVRPGLRERPLLHAENSVARNCSRSTKYASLTLRERST